MRLLYPISNPIPSMANAKGSTGYSKYFDMFSSFLAYYLAISISIDAKRFDNVQAPAELSQNTFSK